jgi:hypothetical protein
MFFMKEVSSSKKPINEVRFEDLEPRQKVKAVNKTLGKILSACRPPSSRDFKESREKDIRKASLQFGIPVVEIRNLLEIRSRAEAGAIPILKKMFAA